MSIPLPPSFVGSSAPRISGIEQVANNLLSIYEKVGLSSPTARTVFWIIVSLAGVFLLKPSIAFRYDGTMRPLKGLSNEDDATYLWAPFLALIIAFILSSFP